MNQILANKNGIQNTKSKMTRKKFDSIVLNIQGEEGVGFGYDTNKISILNADDSFLSFELKSKQAVALDIVTNIKQLLPKHLFKPSTKC